MKHALRRPEPQAVHPRPGSPRLLLPTLLLGLGAVTLTGLATVPAAAGPAARAAPAETPALRAAVPNDERWFARASRAGALRRAASPAASPVASPAAGATAQAAARAAAPPARAAATRPASAPRRAPRAARRVAPPPAPRTRPARSGGRCPVPSASFTDTYGAARPGGRSHLGTDLMAPHGAPVHAVTSGVTDVSSSRSGGLSLYLRADNGERYFYAHNSANLVSDGQRVSAGDLIARVGNTGNARSTDPHVHFERQVAGGSVNPYAFLRRLCG